MAAGIDSAQDQAGARSGVDTSTLIVAAAASLVAAVVTSKLWASGTLISTAMTPVIVSLVKEWLQRPVEKIGAAAKAPLVAVRSGSTVSVPALGRRAGPPEAARRGRVLDGPRDPDPADYERFETVVPPGEDAATDSPYRVYRSRTPRTPRQSWWAVGLITGLVAFLTVVAIVTIPEIVGGKSVAGTGRTTLFSHHRTSSSDQKSNDATTTGSSEGKTTTTPAATTPGATSTPATSTPAPASPATPTTSTPSGSSAPTQTAPTPPAPGGNGNSP